MHAYAQRLPCSMQVAIVRDVGTAESAVQGVG